MKASVRRNVGVGILVLMCGAAVPAFAQDAPKLGVTIGYAALRVSNNPCDACDWKWYQLGFNVDAATPLNDALSIVGELGWARHAFREDPTRHVGGLNAISAGGGVRYNFANLGMTSTIAPYAQVLVGLHRDTFDGGSGSGLVSFTGPGIPANSFMVHPGFGVLIPVTPSWGVVGQVDYRRIFSDPASNAVRTIVGIRLNSK